MKTLHLNDILPNWAPGKPMSHGHLALIPLHGGTTDQRFMDYLLADEAIKSGKLAITEVSASGTVPELMAINQGDHPVLLIDGEELQGAKQNRILNTSVLLRAKSKTRIPVSCVEEGRWSVTSPEFRTGTYAPSSLRQRKSSDVQMSLRTTGRAESDQYAVWESVSEHISSRKAASPTRAMADAVTALKDVLKDYRKALGYPKGACGVVAAVRGRFIAMDVFDSSHTLKSIWTRLIAGYAMDAESSKGRAKKAFTEKAVGALLEHLAEQSCEAFRSAGMGHDLRFEAGSSLGQGLYVKKTLLHLSVFPSPAKPDIERAWHSRISPPSRRR